MSIYVLYSLVGATIAATIGVAIAQKYNRIKAGTYRIISLLSAAVFVGYAIASIWASFENSQALERFHTQLENVRERTADMKKRVDANAAALRRVGVGQQAGTAAERQHVLGLVKEASEFEAEGRKLRNEIDDIGNELGDALRAKETRAFWRTLALPLALLPLIPIIYLRHAARQRAVDERNVALIAQGIDPKLPSDRVRELAHGGRKIRAINVYRRETGASLADAKQAVENCV
jgi:hypothetical protein